MYLLIVLVPNWYVTDKLARGLKLEKFVVKYIECHARVIFEYVNISSHAF